MLIKKQQ